MKNIPTLAEVSAAPQDAYVTWNIPLPPHVDAERITIDTQTIRTTGKIAGFGQVSFEQYIGERADGGMPTIAGFDNGTATAGMTAAASKVKRHTTSLEPGSDLARDYQLSKAHLRFNRQELTDRVINRKPQVDNNDTKAWAIELNAAYKGAMRGAARQNLLKSDTSDYFYAALLATLPMSYDDVVSMGVMGAVYASELGSSLWHNKRVSGAFHLDKKRWSLFPHETFQPDRFALTALSTLNRVISYRK